MNNLKLIEGYFAEIYFMQTDKGKYFVKTIPPGIQDMENEGHITEYLYSNGINVPRLLKTKNGMYHVETDEMQFHVQEFIEGDVLKVNTAPEWYLEQSANIIGKIHHLLKSYAELPARFDEDFFRKSNVNGVKSYYCGQLDEAVNQKNTKLIPLLEDRIKHLERISAFNIDAAKLTYSNAHGDFTLGIQS